MLQHQCLYYTLGNSALYIQGDKENLFYLLLITSYHFNLALKFARYWKLKEAWLSIIIIITICKQSNCSTKLKASELATKTNKGKGFGNLKAVQKLSLSKTKFLKYFKNEDVATVSFLNYTCSLVFLLSPFQFDSLQPHPGLRLTLHQKVHTINDTSIRTSLSEQSFPKNSSSETLENSDILNTFRNNAN